MGPGEDDATQEFECETESIISAADGSGGGGHPTWLIKAFAALRGPDAAEALGGIVRICDARKGQLTALAKVALRNIEEDVLSASVKLSRAQQAYERQQSQLAEASLRNESLRSQVDACSRETTALVSTIAQKEQEHQDLQSRVVQSEALNRALAVRLESADRNFAEIGDSIREVEKKTSEKLRHLCALEASLEELELAAQSLQLRYGQAYDGYINQVRTWDNLQAAVKAAGAVNAAVDSLCSCVQDLQGDVDAKTSALSADVTGALQAVLQAAAAAAK